VLRPKSGGTWPSTSRDSTTSASTRWDSLIIG
jgi:hypothetical protein